MRDKKQMKCDLAFSMEHKGMFLVNYDLVNEHLWDLGYRRLEPSEIKILEMIEGNTPIDEIEKYRNEEL